MKEMFSNPEITVLLYTHGQVKAFRGNSDPHKTIECEGILKSTLITFIPGSGWRINLLKKQKPDF